MKPTPEQIAAAKARARGAATEDEWIVLNKAGGGEVSDNARTILLAALEAAEADGARLDWVQSQLANMDSKARGTWLRIGDKGRIQVHRYPLHAMDVWDDSSCVVDSITECGTNDVREALDAARKEDRT